MQVWSLTGGKPNRQKSFPGNYRERIEFSKLARAATRSSGRTCLHAADTQARRLAKTNTGPRWSAFETSVRTIGSNNSWSQWRLRRRHSSRLPQNQPGGRLLEKRSTPFEFVSQSASTLRKIVLAAPARRGSRTHRT